MFKSDVMKLICRTKYILRQPLFFITVLAAKMYTNYHEKSMNIKSLCLKVQVFCCYHP
jgi:hypothetical protein